MRILILLLSCFFISACNKRQEIKNGDILAVYKGKVRLQSSWHYQTPTGIDSGSTDSSYEAKCTIVKHSETQLGVSVVDRYFPYHVYEESGSGTYYFGDPHHGGYFLSFPNADSIYIISSAGSPYGESSSSHEFFGKK